MRDIGNTQTSAMSVALKVGSTEMRKLTHDLHITICWHRSHTSYASTTQTWATLVALNYSGSIQTLVTLLINMTLWR